MMVSKDMREDHITTCDLIRAVLRVGIDYGKLSWMANLDKIMVSDQHNPVKQHLHGKHLSRDLGSHIC